MKKLDEKLLASDFTFGFELEGYLKWDLLKSIKLIKDINYEEFIKEASKYTGESYDFLNDNINTYADYFRFIDEYNYGGDWTDSLISQSEVFKYAEKKFNIEKYFPDKSKWIKKESTGFTDDGSLEFGSSFEWRSPVMIFTPESIAHCISFLKHFKKVGYTDDSCGFHTHISFPGITEEDAMWITIKLSQDPEMIKKIQKLPALEDRGKEYSNMKYEPISFISGWAESDYLIEIDKSLRFGEFERVYDLLDDSKYRALRIHPQGTLEWRSPRGFLDEDSFEDNIKSFFLSLYDFISWMRNALDSDVAGNYDRYNLMELIKSYGVGNDRIFYEPQIEKEDKYRSALLRSIENPNVLIQFGETPSMRLLYTAFTKINSKDRELIKKSIMSLVYSGKKFPKNILALIFITFETEELKYFVHFLNQSIPVREIERSPGGGIYKILRVMKYLSKDEAIQVINDSNSFQQLFDGYKADYIFNEDFYMPIWLKNAIIEKYGKPIDKDKIIN